MADEDCNAALELEAIAAVLCATKQRATYGAVAGVLNLSPKGLMNDRPKLPKYSWIVSADTGAPTGYEEQQIDPDCVRQIQKGDSSVIRDSQTLFHALRLIAKRIKHENIKSKTNS